MKKITLATMIVAYSTSLLAQELPKNKQGNIIIDKTAKVTANKDKLFEGALQWIAAEAFNKPEKGVSFNEVISYQSREEGKIFGTGKFKFDTKYPKLGYYDYMYLTFTFKMYVKDKEYHYVFSDFKVNRLTWHKRDHIGQVSLEDYEQTGYYRKHSEVSIKEHLNKLEVDLKLAMQGNL